MMTSEEYHQIDYLVMEKAFAIHNKYGRFQDESTYRDELAYQIHKFGLSVEIEVPLRIEYDSFLKTYFMDIVINDSIIYELKATESLCNHSRSQSLNYQLISEFVFGKLINFGANSVEPEFSTTNVTRAARCSLHINDEGFIPISSQPSVFHTHFSSLLSHWGTHLEIALYKETLIHLLGGERKVLQKTNILSADRIIGTKRIHQISEGETFKISGLTNPICMETHLQRFLNNSDLQAIHWINMNNHNIEIRTLQR